MKIFKTVLVLFIVLSLTSCDNTLKSSSSTEEITANFEKISMEIDGMTCEIGCARTIQTKLSKTKGVKMAEVNFESKTSVVEFDSNIISKNQIVEVVEKIAGGDLYKINSIK